MPKLLYGGSFIEYSPGESILESLRRHGMGIESPCDGKGLCGKCRIRVLGYGGPLTEEEQRFLSREDTDRGVRLACLCRPEGDIEVIEEVGRERGLSILEDGDMPSFPMDPAVKIRTVKLPRPALKDGLSLLEHLESALGKTRATLSILRRLPDVFDAAEATAVFHDGVLIDIVPGRLEEVYGLAVDIGTTTVVASLVSLSSGEILGSSGSINPQKDFGLDVISRIHRADQDGGLEGMRSAIVDRLNEMIDGLCEDKGKDRSAIYEMAVGCNSTMGALLLGINPRSLGKAPFSPVVKRGLSIPSAEVGFDLAPGAMLYALPGVSAYIGSDIVAGMLATELNRDKGIRLFIDIGTNGEIVLSRNGALSSCSCAAGPALEGMNISCGMRASEGAVESVSLKNGVELKVIGGVSPTGICGSAILDVLSEMVGLGMIGKTGRLKPGPLVRDESGTRKLVLSEAPPLAVNQSDIRQVQLARGAILSGFLSLLEANGLNMDDLDEVLVAGQFGRHLSADSLTGSGLIPAELRDKIRYCGNTSRTGTIMCLLSRSAREKAASLSGQVDYLELSVLEGYDRLFARCLQFEVPK